MDVAIIGGTGYGAVELIRFLHNHPHVHVTKIISHSNSGTDLAEVYPHLVDIIDLEMIALDIGDLAKEVELVFFATPSNVSKHYIPALVDQGVRCIDLSGGDFRLRDGEKYQAYYGGEEMVSQSYINQAVYGLPELNKEQIKQASILANPGCFPTATTLGLIPVLEKDLVERKSIIIDAKTGTSGAGRGGLSLNVHFSEMNENFKAYQLGVHKHIPEIEQVLTARANEDIQVTFTPPHIVPMTRGIMSTMYVDLKDSQSTGQLIAMYEDYYKNDPFVRIRKEGIIPSTREVYGSNYCDIGLYADQRTGKLIIVSVIDNLVKGASGQAIQNMNIMCGWDETTGLNQLPIYP
ncbi:N-acetyl-gamma-glutamyl-phosphate reductase [Gracilibacillus boraciitolerans JCM 21714]|uniref:N-acetyl-gamma-glutamyl-phosphate reductase n=1 Tax=Gracilibacillus boraciitolerans JCM 21714 TaxID=1298598 RepID=W4VH92_9BACI|nr:N-acetyl-gamma-glutamyl-phosphate reductase [Gracilibacillus boraciitolerans]GAE92129.1 N-acetyl-gamma-glutamyl-phosphate reductase [Gracilibacillus boraciitolerans JCM 21714]